MIYIALFRYGCWEKSMLGEFTFIAEAHSQEGAEIQLQEHLREVVKNEDWLPAPCRILMSQLAVMESFPPPHGIILHLRRAYLDASVSGFPLKHYPCGGVKMLHDWDEGDLCNKPVPQPLFIVTAERTLNISLT
jgi:hypothetical protein